MKETIQLIALVLSIFILPMITSWLLDWHWIANSWPRYTLVIILMIGEAAAGIYMLKIFLNRGKRD